MYSISTHRTMPSPTHCSVSTPVINPSIHRTGFAHSATHLGHAINARQHQRAGTFSTCCASSSNSNGDETSSSSHNNGNASNARNGASSPSIHASHDLETVRRELLQLQHSVELQQKVIEQQQETIRALVNGTESPKPSPLLQKLKDADEAAMRQLSNAAISDRRSLGLFDARFHSTSTYVSYFNFIFFWLIILTLESVSNFC